MKICANCNCNAEDEAVFCPSCGAFLEDTPAPAEYDAELENYEPESAPEIADTQKPKSSKTLIGIIVAAVVVVALIVLAVFKLGGSSKKPGSPSEAFVTYQENLFVTQLLEVLKTESTPYEFEPISSDITITGSSDNEMLNTYLNGSQISMNINNDGDMTYADIGLDLMGKNLLDASVTYENGVIGLYIPSYEETVFTFDMVEVVSELMDTEISIAAMSETPDFTGKELAALIRTYLDIVETVVTDDNVEAKETSYQLSRLGDKIKGDVYTFKPQAQELEAMLIKLADHLEKDENLRSAIEKIYGTGIYSYMDIGTDFSNELNSGLVEAAGEIRTDAAEIAQSIVDSGFIWTLYMEDETVRMIEISANDVIAVYEMSGDEKQFTTLFYILEDGISDPQVLFSCDYLESKNSISYDYKFEMSSGEYVQAKINMVPDTCYGTIEIIAYDSGNEIGFKIDIAEGKNSSTDITLTLIASESMMLPFTNVTLNINATGKGTATPPVAPYKDVTGYSESELQELLEGMLNSIIAF